MTNKEAIEFSKNMISQEGGRAIGASDFMLELCGYHVTALRMGIKALEQEPKTDVLDKIRAEINGIAINGQVDEHTSFIRTGEQVKQMALNIIDGAIKEGDES